MKVLLKQEGNAVVVIVPLATTIEELAKQNPGAKIIDDSKLPSREFRDAWTIDGSIDLAKAKEIWKNKIRRARKSRLEALDIQWQKAFEDGNIKIAATFAAKKKILRDLTEREELTKATSIAQLIKFWPFELE